MRGWEGNMLFCSFCCFVDDGWCSERPEQSRHLEYVVVAVVLAIMVVATAVVESPFCVIENVVVVVLLRASGVFRAIILLSLHQRDPN